MRSPSMAREAAQPDPDDAVILRRGQKKEVAENKPSAAARGAAGVTAETNAVDTRREPEKQLTTNSSGGSSALGWGVGGG